MTLRPPAFAGSQGVKDGGHANGNALIDWCELVASPILHAAAGRPISYAAQEALFRLSEIFASLRARESLSPSEKQTSSDASE